MTVPVINTFITSGAETGAAGLMKALHDHFNTEASALFEIDSRATVNGSPTGSSGFVITPKGADDFQIILRRKDTDEVYISIDPDGDITNSGNTSTAATGSTDETSPEKPALRCDNVTSLKVIVAEWADRLAILVLDDATQTLHKYTAYMGKIIMPLAGTGRSGLGVLGYEAQLGTSTWGWAQRTASPAARLLHVNAGGTQAQNWDTAPYVDDQNLASGVDGDGVKISPSALIVRTFNNRTQGVLQDFFEFGTEHTPGVRVENPSDGTDMFLYVGNLTQGLVMRWPDGVDPASFA